MSLFSNIGILGSALRNFELGLNVASNNLSNVNTPGYSRTRLTLQPLAPVADGKIQMGTGAFVSGIQRLRNIFLDNQTRLQLGELGKAEGRSVALADLAAIFPEIANAAATSGIQGALNNLSNQWTALAAAPTSAAAQTSVRDALDTLAQRLNQDARLIYDLQRNVDLDVTNKINEVNTLLDRIASFNLQISTGRAAGQGSDPNSLLDARETAAEQLSELIGGNYRITGDGNMTVTFSGGTLVDHNQVFHLKAIPLTTDPGRTGIGYYDRLTNVYTDVTSLFTEGKIGGLIQARDIDADEARLALDKIAFGIVQRTNEINKSAIAADLSTNHQIFTGTKASDITLDPILRSNVSYIGSTRDSLAPGDVATIQAGLKNILMYSDIQSAPFTNVQLGAAVINPTAAISTQVANIATTLTLPPPATFGEFVISSGGNALTIQWQGTDSINDIIRNINTAGGGAIFATYDQTAQKMFIYSSAPMSVWDTSQNFAKAMKLSSVVTSSAPINNSPLSGYNKAVAGQAFNSTTNKLNLFTDSFPPLIPASNYSFKVDGNTVNWQPTSTITSVLTAMAAATASPNQISQSFNPNTQILTLVKTGDQIFNPGSLTAATPMNSITVSDVKGNFTRVFNLDTSENASRIISTVISGLSAKQSSTTVLQTQAQNLVDQTKALQDQQSAVNIDEEIAQAQIFQRSYEASVRLQTIMDEMLNVLINHTGSPSSGSGSSF